MSPHSVNGWAPAELCLRFACHGCRELLVISVPRMSEGKQHCPACGLDVLLPPLDERVRGVEIIRGPQPPPVAAACPACHRRLFVAPGALNKPQACPGCRSQLKFKLVREGEPVFRAASAPPSPAPETPAPPPPKSNNGAPRSEPKLAPASPSPNGQSSPRPTKPPPKTHAAKNSTATATAPAPPTPPPRPEPPPAPEPVPEPTGPKPLVYGESNPGGQHSSTRSPPLLSPRGMRWCIWLVLQFALPITLLVIGSNAHQMPLVLLGLAFWIPILALPRRLTEFLVPFFVSTIACPGCQEEYEAVSRWSCSCGYHDHREQHILGFHCPKCHSVLGYTDCARCGATIILR